MNFLAGGKRIQALRRAQKMTQEELAEKAELSRNHISDIERGIKIPQVDTIVAIANALGGATDDILCDYVHQHMATQSAHISADLADLPSDDQAYIVAALEALIQAAKNKNQKGKS